MKTGRLNSYCNARAVSVFLETPARSLPGDAQLGSLVPVWLGSLVLT